MTGSALAVEPAPTPYKAVMERDPGLPTDKAGRAIFAGNCGLCARPGWRVESKGAN